MKNLLLILLIPFFGFSQKVVINSKDEFTKAHNIKVTCTKSDKWKTSDSFVKGWIGLFLGTWYTVPKDATQGVYYIEIGMSGHNATVCFSEYEGKMIWLFEDDSTSELTQFSRTDCGQITISARYVLPENELEKFLTKKVKKVRIYTTEGYADFEVKENKIEPIQQTFSLLKETAEKQ